MWRSCQLVPLPWWGENTCDPCLIMLISVWQGHGQIRFNHVFVYILLDRFLCYLNIDAVRTVIFRFHFSPIWFDLFGVVGLDGSLYLHTGPQFMVPPPSTPCVIGLILVWKMYDVVIVNSIPPLPPPSTLYWHP